MTEPVLDPEAEWEDWRENYEPEPLSEHDMAIPFGNPSEELGGF